MPFTILALLARFPKAASWVTSQAVPLALGAVAIAAVYLTHVVSGWVEHKREESRAQTICRAEELAAENAGLKSAAAQKDAIIASRTRALEVVQSSAATLETELGETREKLATTESRARVCVPAGDGWLRQWQGRDTKVPDGGRRPVSGALPRS